MKLPYLLSEIVILFGCSTCDGQGQQEAMELLGRRFVSAIQEDNFAGYAQCWLAGEVMTDMVARDESMSEPQRKATRSYFLERDRLIVSLYQPLRHHLREIAGDLKQLRLKSIHGDVAEFEDVKTVGEFVVILHSADGQEIRLMMDDGIEVDGYWYFSDRPRTYVTVKEGSKEKHLRLIED
jgi:hypothetical protein